MGELTTGWLVWETPIRSRLSLYSSMLHVPLANDPSALLAVSTAPSPHRSRLACISPRTCPNSCVSTLLVRVAGSGMRTRPLVPL